MPGVNKLIYKICKLCKNKFLTRKDRGIYCSVKCRGLNSQKKIQRICQHCNKVFQTTPSGLKFNGAIYCSRKCSDIDCGKRIQQEKHVNWKGSKVSYRGLHKWVSKYKTITNNCKHCGKFGTGHSMHWANKSGKYLRDLNDWIRLCPKCHGIYGKSL